MGKGIKKTHLDFLNCIPDFIHESYEVINKYQNDNSRILLKDKVNGFIFNLKAGRVISAKTKPTIRTCTNKTSYFSYLVNINNPNFKVIGEYINENIKILIEDELGIVYSVFPRHLYRNYNVTLQSAIDKIEGYKIKIKNIHGDKYNLHKTLYNKWDDKVIAECSIHGEFEIKAVDFYYRGCPMCGRENSDYCGWSHNDWINSGNKSKKFDSFKVYVIKCFNDKEEFIKIGKTFKTINERFGNGNNQTLPYNYKVLKIISGEGLNISKMEKEIHSKFKSYRYFPRISFYGERECFSIDIEKHL